MNYEYNIDFSIIRNYIIDFSMIDKSTIYLIIFKFNGIFVRKKYVKCKNIVLSLLIEME